jgi:hypothetical protein
MNLQTLRLYLNINKPGGAPCLLTGLAPARAATVAPALVHGDSVTLHLYLASPTDTLAPTATPVLFDDGSTFVLAGKNPANLAGPCLFSVTGWTTAPTDPETDPDHYVGDLNLNTTALNTLFNARTTPLTVACDLEIQNAANTHRITYQFDLTVRPQRYAGTEGVPVESDPLYPSPASLELKANKGTANGYAPLDSDGKVPADNLPPLGGGGGGGIEDAPNDDAPYLRKNQAWDALTGHTGDIEIPDLGTLSFARGILGSFTPPPPPPPPPIVGLCSLRVRTPARDAIIAPSVLTDGINNSAPLAIPPTGIFTLEFWLKTTNPESGFFILADCGGFFVTKFSIWPGDIRLRVVDGSWTNYLENDVATDSWRHIAIQRSNAGLIALYVDGSLLATSTDPLVGDITQLQLAHANQFYDSQITAWMAMVQLSNVERYSQTFVPSATSLHNDSNMLVGFDFLDGSLSNKGTLGGTLVLTDNGNVVITNFGE